LLCKSNRKKTHQINNIKHYRMITSNAIETMTTLLGSNYQILANEQTDLVVLAKLPDEDLAAKNTSFNG